MTNVTIVRVYMAYRHAGKKRYKIQRDPARGEVSPQDHRWPLDRDPLVGDLITAMLPGQRGRCVIAVRREWIEGRLHVTADSWKIGEHPESPQGAVA